MGWDSYKLRIIYSFTFSIKNIRFNKKYFSFLCFLLSILPFVKSLITYFLSIKYCTILLMESRVDSFLPRGIISGIS